MQWAGRGVVAPVRTVVAGLVVGLVVGLAVGLVGSPAYAVRESQGRFAPVLRSSFADPSVARFGRGYVAVSTGYQAPRAVARGPRGPWHQIRPALRSLPRWAKAQAVWAAEIDRRGPRWTLYYAALERGERTRCIGAAWSRTATGRFHPVRGRPLVCPRHGGVIDPSTFVGRHQRRYLLYRTQGVPASIRVVRLTGDGLHRRAGSRSLLLARSRGIVENPLLVRRGPYLVLFTSEGYYGNCAYRTTWRRARTLAGLRHARPHVLLSLRRTGLCGPGGADLVRTGRRARGATMYFHAWACGRGTVSCPLYFLVDRHARPFARRAMYAARLRWHHARPHLTAVRAVRDIRAARRR